MKVFTIKQIQLQQYYSIKQKDKCKVVYFNKYKDAVQFIKFLSDNDNLNTNSNILLHQYENRHKSSMNISKYQVEQIEKKPFDYRLGLNHLGYHEVEIIDDTIVCMDSGYVIPKTSSVISSLDKIFNQRPRRHPLG